MELTTWPIDRLTPTTMLEPPPAPTFTVSRARLALNHACISQTEMFSKVFGDSTVVTERALKIAGMKGIDCNWAANRFLGPVGHAKYRKLCDKARRLNGLMLAADEGKLSDTKRYNAYRRRTNLANAYAFGAGLVADGYDVPVR
jgi:hypothetical protein